MTRKSHPSEPQNELSVAEAFALLSLEWPATIDPLIAWSDADFGLVGAVLIDLSLVGCVDSDLKHLILLDEKPGLDPVQVMALASLRRLGHTIPLDIALNALADRVGDLRAAGRASLAAKNICLTTSMPFNWDFRQLTISQSRKAEVAKLRQSLLRLIESDELPDPREAALIALLHGCEIIGPVLGGKSWQHWLLAYGARIDIIRRMELVGHAVVTAVTEMRLRLRTYLLDAGQDQSTTATGDKANASKANVGKPDAGKEGLYQRSTTTWEWRAFWPEGQIVELPVSWVEITQNADVTEETNDDQYLFVHGKQDNIKIRGKNLKIKPVLEAFDEFIAFGPSAKFRFPEKALLLSTIFPRLFEVRGKLHSINDLLQVMTATGYQPDKITVSKVRHGVSMMFGVQVEFARIQVQDKVYHSISLESPYLTPLRILARRIAVGEGQVAGYSDFLDHILRPANAE